jgi:hypothetical protein
MQAVKLFEKPKQQSTYECKTCSDTGLVELEGATIAKFAWQAYFTMMPCFCELGKSLAAGIEDGKREYESMWENR